MTKRSEMALEKAQEVVKLYYQEYISYNTYISMMKQYKKEYHEAKLAEIYDDMYYQSECSLYQHI